MPTFDVELEDGRILEIDADREPTQDEIYQSLGYTLDTRQSLAGSMGSSAGRGLLGVPKGMVGGLGDIASLVPGLEDNPLQRGAEAFESAYSEALPINPANEGFFPVKAANAIGQAGGMLATSAGSVALKATPAIARAVGLGTAGLLGAEQGGDIADQYGMTDWTDRAASIVGGGATEAATESLGGIGGGTWTRNWVNRAKSAMQPGSALLRFGKTAGIEGVEEIIAGEARDQLTKGIVEEDPERPGFALNGQPLPADFLSMDTLKNRLEEGALGAIGGSVFAGVEALNGRTEVDEALGLRLEAQNAIKDLQSRSETLSEAEQAELAQLQQEDENLSAWLNRQGTEKIRPVVDTLLVEPATFAESLAKYAEESQRDEDAAYWRSPEGVQAATEALSSYAAALQQNQEAPTPETQEAVDNNPLHDIFNPTSSNRQRTALDRSYEERKAQLQERTKAAQQAAGVAKADVATVEIAANTAESGAPQTAAALVEATGALPKTPEAESKPADEVFEKTKASVDSNIAELNQIFPEQGQAELPTQAPAPLSPTQVGQQVRRQTQTLIPRYFGSSRQVAQRNADLLTNAIQKEARRFANVNFRDELPGGARMEIDGSLSVSIPTLLDRMGNRTERDASRWLESVLDEEFRHRVSIELAQKDPDFQNDLALLYDSLPEEVREMSRAAYFAQVDARLPEGEPVNQFSNPFVAQHEFFRQYWQNVDVQRATESALASKGLLGKLRSLIARFIRELRRIQKGLVDPNIKSMLDRLIAQAEAKAKELESLSNDAAPPTQESPLQEQQALPKAEGNVSAVTQTDASSGATVPAVAELETAPESRISPQQDAAYMAAVERGDMETAQKMVDEIVVSTTPRRRIDFNENGETSIDGASVTLQRWGRSKEVHATNLVAWKPGSGLKLLHQLAEWADRNNLRIIGEVRPMTPMDGVEPLSQSQLERLYKLNGFNIYGRDSVARPPREVVISSAVKLNDGRILTGKKYDDAWNGQLSFNRPDEDHYSHGGIIKDNRESLSDEDINNLTPGFITSTGRFVDRKDGFVVAEKAGQVRKRKGLSDQLHSEDFWNPEIRNTPAIAKDAQGNVIPLSQRFNPASPSILYTAPDSRFKDRLAEIADRFSYSPSTEQQEGQTPAQATKDQRTYSDGTPVEMYREGGISGPLGEKWAGEAIDLLINQSPDGPSMDFGRELMGYIRGTSDEWNGLRESNTALRMNMARSLVNDVQQRNVLGIQIADLRLAMQKMLSGSAKTLQSAANSIYQPLQKMAEKAKELATTKADQELGSSDFVGMAKEANESFVKDTKDNFTENLTDSDVKEMVMEEAQNEVDAMDYSFALEELGPDKAKAFQDLIAEIASLDEELRQLAELESLSTPPSTAASAREQVRSKKQTIEELRKSIEARKKTIGDLMEKIQGAKVTGDVVEQARTKARAAKKKKAKVTNNATFRDWVGGAETADLAKFNDLMLKYIQPSGFNREAFATLLANKFQDADPDFIAGVVNRFADLLDGAATEEGATEAAPVNYDARAKRMVAQSLSRASAPEAQAKVDPLQKLVSQRIQGKIDSTKFQEELANLGIEPETALAMERTAQEDVERREASNSDKAKQKAQKALQRAAKAKQKAVESMVKKLSKVKSPDPRKARQRSQFVSAILGAMETGILEEDAVRDSFANAYDLHGLTNERLKELGQMLQDIEKLPEGMVKETLYNEFSVLLNDLAPSAQYSKFAHEALMGYVLGGINTMVMQVSGINRYLNPLSGTLNVLWRPEGTLAQKFGRTINPKNFFRIYFQGINQLIQSLPQIATGVTGVINSSPKGIGAFPTSLANVRVHDTSMSYTPVGRISKFRFEAPKIFEKMGLSGLVNLTKYPAWMASRSFQVIRAAEGLVGSADRNMQWRSQMTEALMKGDNLSWAEAYSRVSDALGDRTSEMWKESLEQAKEEQKQELIAKTIVPGAAKKIANLRANEIMQQKLEEQWGKKLENRDREQAALLGFKQDPITPLGAGAYKIMSRLLNREQGALKYAKFSFLFARFFVNAIETAYFNSPLGLTGGLMLPKSLKKPADEREQNIERIYGSVKAYREARLAQAVSGTAVLGAVGALMAAALQGWDPDDDEPPVFWMTGDPLGEFQKKGMMESTGWWKPNTLYLGPLRINYVNTSPEMAMTMTVAGNLGDRFMFDKLLNYRTNEITNEKEFDAQQAYLTPITEAMLAPMTRSTYRQWVDALEKSAESKWEKAAKLITAPITGTATALTLGIIPSLKTFEKAERQESQPKTPRSIPQALASNVPFADSLGLDRGKPLTTPFGDPLTPFSYFSMFTNEQEVDPEVGKAARTLANMGLSPMGPEVTYHGGGIGEISVDGKRYLLNDEERAVALHEIGIRFAKEVNRNEDRLRRMEAKEGRKKVSAEVSNLGTKAKTAILRKYKPERKKPNE